MERIETRGVEYAGFWLRFVAYIIDYAILQILNFVVVIPVLGLLGLGIFTSFDGFNPDMVSEEESIAVFVAFISAISSIALLTLALQALYYAFMQSSSRQATVGKLALSLKVTDMEGGRIDFGKALLRELCKILSSAIFLIGYLMAGFTDKKQALHDIIPGTLVVKG